MIHTAAFLLAIALFASQQAQASPHRYEVIDEYGAWRATKLIYFDRTVNWAAERTADPPRYWVEYTRWCPTGHFSIKVWGHKEVWEGPGTTSIKVDAQPAISVAAFPRTMVGPSDVAAVRALFRGGKTARISISYREGGYAFDLDLDGFTEASDWVESGHCD